MLHLLGVVLGGEGFFGGEEVGVADGEDGGGGHGFSFMSLGV